jgi:hypothetical protein
MAIGVQAWPLFLQVFDMPTSIRFYRDVVGFTVVGLFFRMPGCERGLLPSA